MNTNSFGQRAAAPEKNTTRLVSIVSKPIKVGVVVVVIVVVLVKKIRFKKLNPKTIHVQKPLGL